MQSRTQLPAYASSLRADAQAPADPPKDTVEPARPSLARKVGITALGFGSVGGAAGFAIDLFRGQGLGGPAWATGVTVGLVAGAAIGAATYFATRSS
ncbi:MAG: hypothetical protein HY319_17295 [Armatimonadetes bacterium]|nr:hypothetical protein [Armatimonadota bacterium]